MYMSTTSSNIRATPEMMHLRIKNTGLICLGFLREGLGNQPALRALSLLWIRYPKSSAIRWESAL